MASQAPAYAALLAGGVGLVAAIKGGSIREVLAGNNSPIRPLTTAIPSSFGGGSSSAAGASMQTAAFVQSGPGGGVAPSQIPSSHKAAELLQGLGSFDGHQVALWIIPFLRYARSHGWKGSVTSGYRSYAEQARIYNSGVRPAAVPGSSNHEGQAFPRGAIDVTEAAQLSAILERLPGGSLLKWAGSADPVHFSFPHGGGY